MPLQITDYQENISEIVAIGVKPDGTPCLITCNADGTLDVGLTFSGTVNIGTVGFDQSTPGATNGVVVNASALPTGAATQTTLAALLAKVIAAPATEAAQTTAQSSLTSIDGKVATETTLAAILAKFIAAPATEATLAALNAKATAINTGAVVVASGAITSTPVAPSFSAANGLESSHVVKASAGRLLSITGYNAGPAQFVFVQNATSVQAAASDLAPLAVPAQSSFAYEWTNGIPFSTGITLSNSTDATTRVAGSANCIFSATYL